jgi:GntR family transcriptional regulator
VSALLASSRPSGITLYARIASVLRSKIASGSWPVGDMIPTVAELSREYGTAKVTIRQAFKVLSDEGLLKSQRGKGTFVSAPPDRFPQDNFDRVRDARRAGERTRVLGRKLLPEVPPLIAYGSRIASGKFDFIRKVHSAGTATLFVIDVYIDEKFHKRLSKDEESAIPAVKLLNSKGAGARIETTVTVSSADAEMAVILGCEFASPVSQVIRIVRNKRDQVVLASRATYRAELFAMQFVQTGEDFLASRMGSNVRNRSR